MTIIDQGKLICDGPISAGRLAAAVMVPLDVSDMSGRSCVMLLSCAGAALRSIAADVPKVFLQYQSSGSG